MAKNANKKYSFPLLLCGIIYLSSRAIATPTFSSYDRSRSVSISSPLLKKKPLLSTKQTSEVIDAYITKTDVDELMEQQSATVMRGGDVGNSALMQRLKIGFYFALWYALNVVYNSKFMRNVLKL